jgi:hypothetical protein
VLDDFVIDPFGVMVVVTPFASVVVVPTAGAGVVVVTVVVGGGVVTVLLLVVLLYIPLSVVVAVELVRALRHPAAITSAPAATAVNTTR